MRALRMPAETPGTKLILRAKKTDIEAFQEGKIDLDEFRKKVNLMVLEGQWDWYGSVGLGGAGYPTEPI